MKKGTDDSQSYMNDQKKGTITVAKKEETKVEDIKESVDETEEVIMDASAEVEETEAAAEEEAEVVEETEPTAEELLAAKEAEIAEGINRLQRNMAEFDNFRKRTIKEKSQMYEKGAKEVLDKLLPVIDNFERAFDAATDEHKDDPFVKGIDMIYKQVLGMLDELGVEEIEAKGQPFDPELHHAVQHEESEDHDENIVAEVYQKGYTYKDTVLRYSMVKVVN